MAMVCHACYVSICSVALEVDISEASQNKKVKQESYVVDGEPDDDSFSVSDPVNGMLSGSVHRSLVHDGEWGCRNVHFNLLIMRKEVAS